MPWNVPRMWDGGSCIIIGGGPSVLEQFNVPAEIVQGVYSGKLTPAAYSPYLEALHDQHVIAVNVAYKMGSWADILFFGDTSTWTEDKEGISNFKGLRITCAENIDKANTKLKFVTKNPRKKIGITTQTNLVSWNYNSGAAAMNIAVHTGVKRIILLGFDMKLDTGQNQHWHKLYASPIKVVQQSFNKHLIGFPEIKKDLDLLGIEVINCNPNSAIECFKKINFKDLQL